MPERSSSEDVIFVDDVFDKNLFKAFLLGGLKLLRKQNLDAEQMVRHVVASQAL